MLINSMRFGFVPFLVELDLSSFPHFFGYKCIRYYGGQPDSIHNLLILVLRSQPLTLNILHEKWMDSTVHFERQA